MKKEYSLQNNTDSPLKTPKKRSFRIRIVRILLAVGIFCILLSGGGLLFQELASRQDAQRYPAPGKLVDIGGYRLHIDCQGEGENTVILDAGLGVTAVSWSKVQPEIARTTRVCSYDRAGYGWSDDGPEPRSSQQIVKELHILLQKAAVPGPYVLVGHSFGGLNMRLYAATYPQDVKGLVLVDSMHEDQWTRMPHMKPDDGKNTWLIRLGGARLLKFYEPMIEQYIPTTHQSLARAQMYQTRHFTTLVREEQANEESFRQIREMRNTLTDMPLIVLTAGREADLGKQNFAIWQELQKDLARLSSQAQQTIVPDSGHLILLEKPEMVVDAITQLLSVTT